MKRLMLAALLALVLVTSNFVTAPLMAVRASGCDDAPAQVSTDEPTRCPVPLWRQGDTRLA